MIYADHARITKELRQANKQLARQFTEKEKRAAELSIANIELKFQNKEKESRAAELVIANEELVFQNNEKEDRATELVAINADLKKAERYQKQYIKGLEKMMYLISHRVRQPISQIVGISNLLQSPQNSDEEVKQMVGHVKTSASRLDIFTRDLTNLIKKLAQRHSSNK
ncbi:MAG: hypothetical protein ACQUHE_11635 [Bacteroidia bacterium]